MKTSRHPKTKYTAFIASTIDGRISLTKNKLPDWTSRDDWNFLQKSLSRYEAVVVGRNTYQAAAGRLRKRQTFVLSRRIRNTRHQGLVTFINPATVNLDQILSKYKTVAVLGGAAVYGFMMENHMVHDLYLTLEPLIFGRGKKMCTGNTTTAQLTLLSVKILNKQGTILAHYTVNY